MLSSYGIIFTIDDGSDQIIAYYTERRKLHIPKLLKQQECGR